MTVVRENTIPFTLFLQENQYIILEIKYLLFSLGTLPGISSPPNLKRRAVTTNTSLTSRSCYAYNSSALISVYDVTSQERTGDFLVVLLSKSIQ